MRGRQAGAIGVRSLPFLQHRIGQRLPLLPLPSVTPIHPQILLPISSSASSINSTPHLANQHRASFSFLRSAIPARPHHHSSTANIFPSGSSSSLPYSANYVATKSYTTATSSGTSSTAASSPRSESTTPNLPPSSSTPSSAPPSSTPSNAATSNSSQTARAIPPHLRGWMDDRPPLYEGHYRTNVAQKALLAVGSAIGALIDPYRSDLVASLGESTGAFALARLRSRMANDPTGAVILAERPRVRKDEIGFEKLGALPETTLGGAYARWMGSHHFDPDERPRVRFVDSEELAYVMTRYREAHDIWHVLLSLPPTVLGELGLKWFEFFQTGLPSTALSAVGGPFAAQLSNSDRVELFRTYVPWARRAANRAVFLMNVYFEQMWEEDIEEVRKKLRIERFAYQGEVMSAHEPH